MPVWHRINQATTDFGPTVQPDHVGLGPGLIDEDQFARIKWVLVLTPFGARLGDVWPILLGRPERLFLSARPSSLNVCQINPTLAET